MTSTTINGAHGSPERMPGALFRAVGDFFSKKKMARVKRLPASSKSISRRSASATTSERSSGS